MVLLPNASPVNAIAMNGGDTTPGKPGSPVATANAVTASTGTRQTTPIQRETVRSRNAIQAIAPRAMVTPNQPM